jgi:hypothetical protein
MVSSELVDAQLWQVAFRISHNGGRIADILCKSQAFKDMRPLSVDREVNLTDLVVCLRSNDSNAAIGMAAVALWDTLDAACIPSPVIENVVLTDGGPVSLSVTTQYEELEKLQQSLYHA